MGYSADGFIRPVRDASLCSACGACQAMCARAHHIHPDSARITTLWGGYAKDNSIRLQSTSGGIVKLLAEHVIRQGGIVFGVELNADLEAYYISIERENEVSRIQGSKYMQAHPGDIYPKLAEALKKKRATLFIGLHCQAKAVRARFGNKPHLFIVDLACFGSPSRLLFESWLKQEAGNIADVSYVSFRDKSAGWRASGTAKIDFLNGQSKLIAAGQNQFHQFFLSELCLNESCYRCTPSPDTRVSDITLGDFWGNAQFSEEEAHNGLSIICCHTESGKALLQQISNNLVLQPVAEKQAYLGNQGLATRPKRAISPARDFVLADLKKLPLHDICDKYLYRGKKKHCLSIGGTLILLPNVAERLLYVFRRAFGKLKRLVKGR